MAGGLQPELTMQDGKLLGHHPLLLRLVQHADGLVDVAVRADLVAGVADALARREVIDDGPAGDEEGGAELQAVEHPEEAVDAHAGTEAALLGIGEASLGPLSLSVTEAVVGV